MREFRDSLLALRTVSSCAGPRSFRIPSSKFCAKVIDESADHLEMKLPAIVGLSAATGLLVGVGVGFALGNLFNPPSDWRDIAAANTMADRRAYTLPLNNP